MGGGDEETFSSHDFPSEGELSSDRYFPQTLPRKAEEETAIQDDELMAGSDDEKNQVVSEFQAKWRRHHTYREVLKCYDDLQVRIEGLAELKTKIRSYSPGTWVEELGGLKSLDYQFPETTCLLLIGPKGSGKSSLVNKISRIFEDDVFAPDRAQISYSCRDGDGTFFLREYMIPRSSNAFCLYDTRALSIYHTDNTKKIKLWMKKGVRNGELLIRGSDGPLLRERMKSKARLNRHQSTVQRRVDFVVFVVNGLSVLKSIEGAKSEETDLITETYDLPYLSFHDDKPAVVVTHGDLLSIEERARVRVHLGELLGIHPAKQVFDIPDISDQATELSILEMLRYSLEHSDRNFPRKTLLSNKVSMASILKALCFCLIQLLGIAIVVFLVRSISAGDHQPRRTHSVAHDRPQTADSVYSVGRDQTRETNSAHHHFRPREAHSPHRCRPKEEDEVVCDRPETAHTDNRRRSETNPEKIHIDWSKIRHVW